MSRFSFALAAAAAIFVSGSASAARMEFPEVKETKPVSCPLKEGATGQAVVPVALQVTDFDAFSSIDDPLYREGSRLLLEKAVKEDAAKERAGKKERVKASYPAPKPAPDLRDAPASRPAVQKILKLRKSKVGKPVHTDPVKSKKAL